MARKKIDDLIENTKETKTTKSKTTAKKSTKEVVPAEDIVVEEKTKKSRKKKTDDIVDEESVKSPTAKKKTVKKDSEEQVETVEKDTKTKKTKSETEEKPKKAKKSSKKEEVVETKKKTTKKPAKKSKKNIDEDEERDFYYGDDDDEDIIENVDIDEEDFENEDEITEDQLELANDLDLDDFEKFEEEEEGLSGGAANKRVFKKSSHSEEVRKRFITICDDFNSGDEEKRKYAIECAIEELKSFVHYVIKKKYSTYGKYYEDLVQEGHVGIIKGLEKYDPRKSLPTTFFNLYIIHEMSKYIDTEVNKTTSHYSSNLTKINRAIDKFEQAGKKWNENDIAIETGLNMETVIQCLHIKEYKNEMYYESDEILEANISEHGDSPEQAFVKNERMETLYKAIGTLLPEEIMVLKYRYGLMDAQTISYKEIAKEMGVSIEKVRKYRHDAIKKLRHKASMRSVFKDYINESETNSITENDVAIIPESMIDNSMKELEEIEFDFDFLNEDDE